MDDRVRAVIGTGRLARVIEFVRSVVDVAVKREVTFLGAAVAYYAFVSLLPLALLAFAVASAIGGEAMIEMVREIAAEVLAPEGEEVLFEALEGEQGRAGASIASVAVLTWGALRVFRGLDIAFSRVYGSGLEKSFLGRMRDAMTVFGAITAGLIGMAIAGAVIALLPEIPGVRGAGPFVVWVTLTVAFLPLYYLMPDVEIRVREALPGAVLAATVFTVLGTLFGFYTAVAGDYAVYGVLGGVLILITWLYVGSTAVMMGAVSNAVFAGAAGDWRTSETTSDTAAEGIE